MNGTIKWLAASSILHTFAAPTSLKGLPSMTSKYIEIMLGNLTPSTPDNPVHPAWWAPRKSESPWNPHLSLAGCAVYRRMADAYPKLNMALQTSMAAISWWALMAG